MAVKNYSASSAAFAQKNNLLVISISGHLVQADGQAMGHDSYVRMQRSGLLAALIDFKRSDVALSADITIRNLDALAALDRSLFKPSAFVVAARDLGYYREIAWRMASLGMVAAAFTDGTDAANFAVRKGEVWQAELRFRRAQAAPALQCY